MSQRWRIVVEYDGGPFAGWQLQPHAPTIQGELERALSPLLGHHARVHAAGRTDAGVHAAMQVAAFDTSTPRTARAIRNGLNARLPAEIACLEASPVGEDFHPRHSPHTKTYAYTWLTAEARHPLRRGRAWHVRRPLDVAAMSRACAAVVGTHDFSSFQAAGCSAKHPVRTVLAAYVKPHGDEVVLVVKGTGFLRHMVRILAGTLHQVGTEQRPFTDMAAVVGARDRTRAGPTAPAQGLTLAHIRYAFPAGGEPPNAG